MSARSSAPCRPSSGSVELLAPAGNFEKLEIALHYGADAVYLAGKQFSLRDFSGNFDRRELRTAVELAHSRGVKVYVACNTYARNSELEAIADFLVDLGRIAPDAVIVSDPGVLALARRLVPHLPVHVSTQANTTNHAAARFWKDQGASRVNAARELSLAEIRGLVEHSGVEVEVFVHGAMCISYSGRCLLSSAMAGRESNRGRCCHPCRFPYAVVEASRPGQYFPVVENEQGTFIFNAHDLCLVAHLPELVTAGVAALKIEGRMKGINYLAAVVKVYREALDTFYRDPDGYQVKPEWRDELDRVSHRGYDTGFFLGAPATPTANLADRRNPGDRFVAKVIGGSGATVALDVRNKLARGDTVEILSPGAPLRAAAVEALFDADGVAVAVVQPGSRATAHLAEACAVNDLLRRKEVP